MKKFALTFFLAAIYINTFAQETNQSSKPHPIADSIGVKICVYMTANKDSIRTTNELINALTFCIKDYGVSKMEQLLIEDGYVDNGDPELSAERAKLIGKKIGKKVMAECDSVREIVNRLKQTQSQKPSN